MPASPAVTPEDRHAVRSIALWTVFTVLLILGVLLFFRDGGRIVPLLDVMSER